MSSFRRLIGGILLVTGTAIGAGMLALPVVTGEGGFFPAFFSYLLCWMFMTATGLLILEICLRMPPDANLVTMASRYLGGIGKVCAWFLYLFLFYCLSVAYLSGGGGLLLSWIGQELPQWSGILLFLGLLAPVVYVGAKAVDRFNTALMAGLIGSYIAFVVFCLPYVQWAPLERADWSKSLIALPVIFTSFSFQGIIPTLTSYLHRDAKRLRIAIVGGTSAAFVIYLVWEFLILGIVPMEGLLAAKQSGSTAVAPLKDHLSNGLVSGIGQAFAFFAIATSFLGVTLGLMDFLADGLRMSKKGMQRLQIAALTFAPPAVIALVYPALFIKALIFAGGIGCSLLLGLLPILMVYSARYHSDCVDVDERQLGGGKVVLVLLFLFVMFELGIEAIAISGK